MVNICSRGVVTTFLAICALTARAESVVVPSDAQLFPPGGADISSFDLSLPQAPDNSTPTQLLFDGSINNTSFFNGANISFWFDWTDTDGTTHTSLPESFTLTAIMGTLTSHAGESFTREFAIPYTPAEVGVHFANQTANSQDGKPVFVTGVFSAVPEPSGLILLATFACLGMTCLRLPRGK
jgi:hypothetical protein